VWFRARDFDHALTFFAGLVGHNGTTSLSLPSHLVLYPTTVGALILGAVLALVRLPRRLGGVPWALADTAATAALLTLSVLAVASGAFSPFLYFRF